MLQIISSEVFLGVVLAIITSLLWNVAPVLKRETVDEMDKIDASNIPKLTLDLFSRKNWVIGISMSILGALTYLFAIQRVGIVVVQPLLNFGLIVLVFLSAQRLGENITLKAGIGITLLILSAIFIAFGGVSRPSLFTGYFTIVLFTLLLIACIVILIIVSGKMPILWAPITALLQALASIYTQWFTLAIFLADNALEALLNGIIPFLILGFFASTAAIYTVPRGIQINPPARFKGIVSTLNMFLVILGGLLIYAQTLSNPIFYAIGLTFGTVGIGLLSEYQEVPEEIEEVLG